MPAFTVSIKMFASCAGLYVDTRVDPGGGCGKSDLVFRIGAGAVRGAAVVFALSFLLGDGLTSDCADVSGLVGEVGGSSDPAFGARSG